MSRAFLVVLVSVVLSALVLAGCGLGQPASPPGVGGWDLDQRVSNGGGVRVRVTPQAPPEGGAPVEFAVTLDTHSVELSDDMARTAELRCAAGDVFASGVWDGAPPGGHHRQGVLRFAPLDHPVDAVELVIRDVGGVEERVFRWQTAPSA